MSVWSSMDGGGDDDWGLQAVVRGCRPTKNQAAVMDLPLFPATEAKGDLTAVFPGLTEARTAHYELEELCKPFFPKPQHHHRHHLVVSPSRSNPSSPSSSAAGAGAGAGGGGPHRQRQPQRPASQTPRSKRRKNQQKRVVCHVPADGVSSDVWAWRKYGQKPIKGSPYPRGYYRCSSSKGCLARKQVERSRTDPGMLVITYTAEHNHPVPTHRNSLAGSTRHKFPTTTTAAAASSTDQPPSATSPTSGAEALSPTTPLTASMDEDQEDEDGVLLVEDMEVVGEDDLLFMGGGDGDGELDSEDQQGRATTVAAAAAAVASGAILEGDVVGGFEDQFFARPWRPNHNAAAAAGGR